MRCEAWKAIGVILLTGGYLMGAADDAREGGELFPVVAGERQT